MTIQDKIGLYGLVPVVVFDDIDDALPTAKAMITGGLPVMEITLRTEQGLPAIKSIAENYPEIVLGAGTVLSVDQAKAAVEAGAKFIVSPGFNDDVVQWCLDNDVMVTPGCVTPTEIEHAMGFGLHILKFFPANLYGGINGCKALYGPYRMIKFIPTGGVNLSNLADFADKPFIHAIGGGWLCNAAALKSKDYRAITKTVKDSIAVLLGLELAHVGINTQSVETARDVSSAFAELLDTDVKEGNSSIFTGTGIEVLKSQGIGQNGHIAIKTNNLDRAVFYLSNRGYVVDESTLKSISGKKIAVYLKNEIGGYGIHLLQNKEQ